MLSLQEACGPRVSEPALNGGANFTTLMKHLASLGLCPTFTALQTDTPGTMYYFYLTAEQFSKPE